VPLRTLPLALILLALLPQGAAAETTTQIIVKREPGLSAAERADIRADADVEYVRGLTLPRTEVVAADSGQVDEALQALRADQDVVFAEVDHRRRAFAEDEYMDYLWGLRNFGQSISDDVQGLNDADSDVVEAWPLLTSPGDGQTIAVVDTGIFASHQDLAGRVGTRRNFVGANAGVFGAVDGDGHGTHVSGTIAANQNNDIGIAGVAPNATIMALKALDDDGAGYDSDIAEAFDYAGDRNDVRVVNASLGGPGGGELLRTVIADHPDKLFVVAAGNGGADGVGDNNDTAPQYPCNVPEPNVLCVGASTNRDERGSFSNYGRVTVDLFAPGQSILSTYLGSAGYAWASGTSMASPHVAAAAALVMQREPGLSAVDVKEVLLTSAEDKSAFSTTSLSGARLNVRAAVQLAPAAATLPDEDGDGIADAADACRMSAASGSADGCPDADEDAVPDASDNCGLNHNPTQVDADQDGIGDACDSTPRGPDVDGDGKPALDDSCPTVYGTLVNGCPAPPPPPPNQDRDSRIDAIDACPTEYALTKNGCPLPALTRMTAKVKKRAVVVKASTSRAAKVRILVQRKKGRKWVKVKRRTLASSGNRVQLTVRRLKRGRHRIVVAVYSNAGSGTSATRYFKVR
jgi:subtilisin family serine protease